MLKCIILLSSIFWAYALAADCIDYPHAMYLQYDVLFLKPVDENGNNRCLAFISHDRRATYEEARASCAAFKSVVAKINDSIINDFVYQHAKELHNPVACLKKSCGYDNGIWIGVTNEHDTWVYGDGTPLNSNTFWAKSEPNKLQEEKCALMCLNGYSKTCPEGKWNNINCSSRVGLTVCEYLGDPLATTLTLNNLPTETTTAESSYIAETSSDSAQTASSNFETEDSYTHSNQQFTATDNVATDPTRHTSDAITENAFSTEHIHQSTDDHTHLDPSQTTNRFWHFMSTTNSESENTDEPRFSTSSSESSEQLFTASSTSTDASKSSTDFSATTQATQESTPDCSILPQRTFLHETTDSTTGSPAFCLCSTF